MTLEQQKQLEHIISIYKWQYDKAIDSCQFYYDKNISGLKKISESKNICLNSNHEPPSHMVLSPGVYEYVCPGCKEKTIIEISNIIS